MIYTGYMRPFELRLVNNMELINDTLILIASYFLIIFSAMVADAETRYKSGWPLIGLLALIVAFNLTVIMIKSISKMIRACKLRLQRRRNRKLMHSRLKDKLRN